MNKSFIVSWELNTLCCWQMQLGFCRGFVSACFPHEKALQRWSRSAQGLPPCPCRGWGCLGSRFRSQRTYLCEEDTPALICWCQMGNSDLDTFWGTSKVNTTHECRQLLKKLSMVFCLWIIWNNVYLLHIPNSPLQRIRYPRSACLSGQLGTFNE